MSLKGEFATYSFQEKRACHAMQGHLGKGQVGQEAERAGERHGQSSYYDSQGRNGRGNQQV